MGLTSGIGQCLIATADRLSRSQRNHHRIRGVSVEHGPGQPRMDDAVRIGQQQLAILQHRCLHWQGEAERLNGIVHAQRVRIRDLEGSPDRLLLRKVVTCLQTVGTVEASALERQLQEMLR